ncbi:hypothetical protein LJ656_15780 [Paraburkholderia sp. MMS20-SJTR3]|uniref:PASTA domain-containing protein n=1 Tax=Paraburkholderia sejongensis TaxID=2886946 RepID=A0ABS8JVY4_9BURK|nr:hypothetical protein [Paraburkholderia sp. MMS20-SJTR3]MCC8394057.1 hypothetical protein [Paraburkholderia sp. MMS20-SJTR3]
MTFRPAALAITAAALALAGTTAAFTAQAQSPTTSDSQWRTASTTLATLLQNGYKIVAVVNGAPHGNAAAADTIFVQRDQSAFKCIDPQQPDPKAKPPVCYELVPPSGAAPASESK